MSPSSAGSTGSCTVGVGVYLAPPLTLEKMWRSTTAPMYIRQITMTVYGDSFIPSASPLKKASELPSAVAWCPYILESLEFLFGYFDLAAAAARALSLDVY